LIEESSEAKGRTIDQKVIEQVLQAYSSKISIHAIILASLPVSTVPVIGVTEQWADV
jgi:hypothetical protein